MVAILRAAGRWTVTHRTGLEPSTVDSRGATIWQDWETDFLSVERPEQGRFAAMRPWDFGPYPDSWAEKVRSQCDELWIHSQWSRDLARRSGIPDERIRVLPLGVDTAVFHPDGPAMDVAGDPSRFRFLYAGATVRRKGFDIALEAFLEAFEPGDPAVLIVKDRQDGAFYSGRQQEGADERLEPYVEAGNLVFLHEHLSVEDLAALYRCADALLLPYRAEGFALTAAEAMACGTPCVVPRFGACLDYCNDANAVLVEPRRICLPVVREIPYNTLGFSARVDEVDFCEVPVDRLAAVLRSQVTAGRSALEERGRNAAATITESFSRERFATNLERAVEGLLGLAGRRPDSPA